MDKFKIMILAAIILLLAENQAFALFDGKYKETLKKLEDTTASYEKLSKDEQELKVKYEAAVKENEALKQDRNNLIAQAKALMVDKGEFKELEEANEKIELEKSTFREELSKMMAEKAVLQKEIKSLQAKQADIMEERNSFKKAYEKSGKDNRIKTLQKNLNDLRGVKNKISASLAKTEKSFKRIAYQQFKLESEKEKLSQQLKQYKTGYNDAVKKNKAFEQELKNMPQKFSELAKQNKRLLKETSQMHYNMGVFYTKNREYIRATSEFEKAIEINPDDTSAHFNLGYIYSEHIVNRRKAIEQFRYYLRLAKKGDKDIEWVRKYILTWQTWEGKETMQ